MNLLLKRILGASFAFAAFSFVNPTPAKAQSCAVAPTCESLGYTLTEIDCEGHNFLKCPFDNSLGYCDGVSGISSESCDNPAVGDILYSDMSCSSNVISGKTPIGIIFNTVLRKAIALDTESFAWQIESWLVGYDFLDIPNINNITDKDKVILDINGLYNTQSIIIYCQNSDVIHDDDCPAAQYAYYYKTAGTKTGDWYLPAAGELQEIFNNYEVLNNSLKKVDGTYLEYYSSHWSSSEYNKDQAWQISFSWGEWKNYQKNDVSYVRPVIQF